MNRFSVSMAMLVMVLAIGLAFVGCKHEVEDPLNGTWESDGSGFIFNNGKFTMKNGGIDVYKGTYTTEGDELIFVTTEMNFTAEAASQMNTSAGWKTLSQAKEVFLQNGMTEEQANQIITSLNFTCSYSIDGNTLVLVGWMVGGTYTRK